MKTFLHKKFKSKFKKHIEEKTRVLLAISGGQDSLCLLQLLHDCLNYEDYLFETIYIDHQWKEDSLNHTNHIINLMKSRKIPLSIYQIPFSSLSENIARQLRYKIFIKCAIENNCTTIITGHNNNDKIETFLQNLTRGTSTNGITHLTVYKQLNKKISILRPLIEYSRSEIAWLCRLYYLPVWSDVTNYNFSIKRNRVRYELMPYLKDYFNPEIQQNLNKFILLCQNEDEYIKENTIKLYLKSTHKQIITLNLKKISKQHHVLQKRVIRLFFYYNFHKQINESFVNRLVILSQSQESQIIFFDKLTIHYYNCHIYINSNEYREQ